MQQSSTFFEFFVSYYLLFSRNQKASFVQNETYFEDYCVNLKQSSLKLKELKTNIETKEKRIELNLTDAQKEADQNIVQLQNKLKETEEECEEYKNKLLSSDKIVEEISVECDNLSLRAKIVSLFYLNFFLI